MKKKKEILKRDGDALHLKLAYNLGRTVKKVSKTVTAVKRTVKGRPRQEREPLPSILKEIKAIADISGLTAAIREMNEISVKHSNHPVISRLTAAIEQLSPAEQEMLSRKFIDKLGGNPYFNNSMYTFPAQRKMTEEDCQKISDAFIESIFYTLEDIGITPQEKEFLQKFSSDITRPINDLVQFYLNPKTFSQKVKRLWRMQRIFIKLIKLINMTNKGEYQMQRSNAFAMVNNESLIMDVVPERSAS